MQYGFVTVVPKYLNFASFANDLLVTITQVAIGGLVVECLRLDTRFEGSNPVEGDEFLRTIKICSTTSFGGEVKLPVPCCKIYGMLKIPTVRNIYFTQNSRTFLA
jgi:hypothetical protein